MMSAKVFGATGDARAHMNISFFMILNNIRIEFWDTK
jgi:hypothetical protein